MLKLKLQCSGHLMRKSWLTGKDPDPGKDWGREEKGTTEDGTVGWLHWLRGHGFGGTPGDGEEQGSLACCGSWVPKSRTRLSDWTELCFALLITVWGLAETLGPSGTKSSLMKEGTCKSSVTIRIMAPEIWTIRFLNNPQDAFYYCL